MKLFLDTSVLLAACGSAHGSSRAVFGYALAQRWELFASPWVIGEVVGNLRKLSPAATGEWSRLRPRLVIVDDVVSLDRAMAFPVTKDKPYCLEPVRDFLCGSLEMREAWKKEGRLSKRPAP